MKLESVSFEHDKWYLIVQAVGRDKKVIMKSSNKKLLEDMTTVMKAKKDSVLVGAKFEIVEGLKMVKKKVEH